MDGGKMLHSTPKGSDTVTPITRWLNANRGFAFTFYASAAAFCLYTCIFALRKTFGVGLYEERVGIFDMKSLMVISQMIGYMLSKFIGIKVVSELQASSRGKGILTMVAIASLAWFFFAITPSPYNLFFLFLNGLPLGMVWGMVFGYLEGRKQTEVLGASLSVSFIFSSGFAKTVGGFITQDWGVTEYWMPFVSCLLFFGPLLLFLWLLNQIPPPSEEDEKLRTKRSPMSGAERRKFAFEFLPGLVILILVYMMLTAFRDFRDNFSANIYKDLNYTVDPGIFTWTEIPITLIVLVVIGSLMVIKNNFKALVINHLIILAGFIIVGISTWAFEQGLLSPPMWMIFVGMGLYFGYIQFNSIFFDRMIATFRYVSTVGFLIYLADSFGYVGSLGIVLFKTLGQDQMSLVNYFIAGGYVMSIAGSVLIGLSLVYFIRKHKGWPQPG
jgi:hypothetical protein